MFNKDQFWSEIVSDLGLERSVSKGQTIPIRRCWHFFTSGESVDVLFANDEDYRCGMNRILSVVNRYEVMILAFVLMDTHVHFVLYGNLDECNKFVHEYIRLTSMYKSAKRQGRKSLEKIEISHQPIEDDRYLKTVICYVVKNPIVAGLPFNAYDYPWSSGALYFRRRDLWTSPRWLQEVEDIAFSSRKMQREVCTHHKMGDSLPMIDTMVFPGAYTAVDVVEKVFRTHRAYNYFMTISKSSDVEERAGAIAHLTIPISELREYRRQICLELYGKDSLRDMDTSMRLRVARELRARYCCSARHVAKACGLSGEQLQGIL